MIPLYELALVLITQYIAQRSSTSWVVTVCGWLCTYRYVAACAPHIQEFLHPPPLRGSYDYLRLTRNNHMPLPTWTYSQLLDDGWDAKVSIHSM